MNTSTIVLSCLHVLTILAVAAVIFEQRKEPATRYAWILVLLFFPVGGIILYLLFGHSYIRKDRIRIQESTAAELAAHIERQREDMRGMAQVEPRYAQLAHMNLLAGSPLTSDNRLEVFNSGREKFERLLEDVRNARHYVHLCYFIFRTDRLGAKLLDLLAEKAALGLDVRLVYDDMGNIAVSDRGFKKLKAAGGKVYRYSPLITGLISANYRNHRKLAIIDGKIGYIGGMNVGEEYVGGRKKLTPWRDTHLRVEGSAALVMEGVFLPDYVYASRKRAHEDELKHFFEYPQAHAGSGTVQILASAPQRGRYSIHAAYVKLISSAEECLYIQSPYLVPDKTIFDALAIAAASGVDVRLMLPRRPDKYFVYMASLSYARALCALGVKIYLYEGFIHSKTVQADGQAASIGSANLDVRSFFLSFEANAIIFDRQLAGEQKKQFELDMESCVLADKAYFDSLPGRVKFLMPLCQLFSPLL